VTNELEVV